MGTHAQCHIQLVVTFQFIEIQFIDQRSLAVVNELSGPLDSLAFSQFIIHHMERNSRRIKAVGSDHEFFVYILVFHLKGVDDLFSYRDGDGTGELIVGKAAHSLHLIGAGSGKDSAEVAFINDCTFDIADGTVLLDHTHAIGHLTIRPGNIFGRQVQRVAHKQLVAGLRQAQLSGQGGGLIRNGGTEHRRPLGVAGSGGSDAPHSLARSLHIGNIDGGSAAVCGVRFHRHIKLTVSVAFHLGHFPSDGSILGHVVVNGRHSHIRLVHIAVQEQLTGIMVKHNGRRSGIIGLKPVIVRPFPGIAARFDFHCRICGSIERVIGNVLNAFGNDRVRKRRTLLECLRFDALGSFRQHKLRDRSIAIEGLLLDHGQGRRKLHLQSKGR